MVGKISYATRTLAGTCPDSMDIFRISSLPSTLEISHQKETISTHAQNGTLHNKELNTRCFCAIRKHSKLHTSVLQFKNPKKSIIRLNISKKRNYIIVSWSISHSNSHQLTKILSSKAATFLSSRFCKCQRSENPYTDDLQTYFNIWVLF